MKLPMRLVFDGISHLVEHDHSVLITNVEPWLDVASNRAASLIAKHSADPELREDARRLLADIELIVLTGRSRTNSGLWPEMLSRVGVHPWSIESPEDAIAYMRELLRTGQPTEKPPIAHLELTSTALRMRVVEINDYLEAATFKGSWVEVEAVEAA